MEVESASPEAIVIGCGVSGLSSAIALLQLGFAVTIIAKDLPPNTTSNAAAAVWEPYLAYPQDKVLRWGSVALEEFYRLMDDPQTGVRKTTLLEVFDHAIDDPWWRPAVRHYERVQAGELPPGYVDGYSAEVALIDTPIYMQYLVDRFRAGQGRIVQAEVDRLADLYQDGRLIVNCSGVGARALAGDEEVFPIRGQVVRVRATGVSECLIDDRGPVDLTYIIPRSQDYILGGTAQRDSWELAPDPQIADEIIRRCKLLAPALEIQEILEHKVGLRPGRSEVRVELEAVTEHCAVIHNYGHAGSGFTLSWGCAAEVAQLAQGFRGRLQS